MLGAAIGLNLLFGIPLLTGVLITAADTLLILWFTHLGIRVIEAFVLSLVMIIAACFAVEILLAKPALGEIVSGLDSAIKRRESLCRDRHSRRDGDAA